MMYEERRKIFFVVLNIIDIGVFIKNRASKIFGNYSAQYIALNSCL